MIGYRSFLSVGLKQCRQQLSWMKSSMMRYWIKKKTSQIKKNIYFKTYDFFSLIKVSWYFIYDLKIFQSYSLILCNCRCKHFLSSNPIFISARYLWLFWIQILKWIKIFPILLKLSLQVQNPFKALLNTLASYKPHLLKTTQDIQISCVIFQNLK